MLPASAAAAEDPEYSAYGGGYAATGQIPEVGFTTELYDASNSLPTSDAMFLLSADDGKIWIGGYSGVIAYDGSVFERLDTAEGLTSARSFFEDSKGRIWVGTNDNGVVVIDGETRVHLTYREGLPSSSIRIFAEDPAGNVFIGTTSGICYADPQLNLHEVPGADLTEERVLKLDTGADGTIYGQTSSGMLFSIEDCAITRLYESRALGMPRVTTLMADPEIPGNVWLGTEDAVYYGAFGDAAALMECIPTGALGGNVHWISYDCGRIWISSTSAVGYLDESRQLRVLDGLAVSSGIEMTTADYQGNLWVASSTQGVMKVVTNNFLDVTGTAGMRCGVADAVHIYGNELYIGTDHGLRILRDDGEEIKNALTARLGGTRVRCIAEDAQGMLWLGTYTNDVGLFCYSPETREYTSFTTENGMPDNQIRCVTAAEDGSIFVGTNGGLAVIENGKVVRTVSEEDGINNTVFLNVAKMPDGTYLAGSDGDGLYVIGEDSVTRLGRDDGLTSEVIMRIIPDEERGVYWLVTSNSIEYLRDGTITPVTTFPYNNNYDIHFDDSGHAWILSSFGVYTVDADEMLHDHITDYSLYTVANGLPYAVTSNAQSTLDTNGDLYMPGRNGIIRVNIHNYFEKDEPVLTGIRSLTCDDVPILPDDSGAYHIPASRGRVQISASVLDYTMLNPTVRIWLEGGPDEGITVQRSDLSALEYTNLPYGNYTLHIQILEKNSEKVLQDDTYQITKAARFSELLIVRILLMLLLAAVTGYVVWRTMRSTVIARQYDEIRHAKEEAER
ncbi:MAG: hybrid sensor histidine kinase/response regulator, partial [Oscillospiraceae bacterium]|nr:hybrid sensor histidine kinase/response regulator [Oscillospiraceae bacterium]